MTFCCVYKLSSMLTVVTDTPFVVLLQNLYLPRILLLICIVQGSPVTSYAYCHYWQFRCNNGQCVNRYNLCDGRSHCYDGSDEWSGNCPRCMWNCKNALIILKARLLRQISPIFYTFKIAFFKAKWLNIFLTQKIVVLYF